MSIASGFPEEISQARLLADFLAADSGVWTSVYRSCHPDRDFGTFSVFAPASQRAEILSRLEWDMHAYDGHQRSWKTPTAFPGTRATAALTT